MKREFEGYFALQYTYLLRPYYGRRRYGPDYFYPFFEEVFEGIPKHWRSDARYFLAFNIVEMVLAPYDAVQGGSTVRIDSDSMRLLVEQDLQLLVERSEEVSRRRDRSYVSSTSVAIALGELAEDLKTNSLQIWGPDASE